MFEMKFVKFSDIKQDLIVLYGVNYLLTSQIKTNNCDKMTLNKLNTPNSLNLINSLNSLNTYNTYNNWLVINIPKVYQSNECYIKNVVIDEKTLNIAISFNKGYLVYNWKNQKWLNSTLNKDLNETLVNNSCMCWWQNILIFSAYTYDLLTKSKLMCHIINSKINDVVHVIKEFDFVSLFYRVFNNKLAIFGVDLQLYIFKLQLILNDSMPSIVVYDEIIFDLSNIVLHPLTLIDISFSLRIFSIFDLIL